MKNIAYLPYLISSAWFAIYPSSGLAKLPTAQQKLSAKEDSAPSLSEDILLISSDSKFWIDFPAGKIIGHRSNIKIIGIGN